LVYESFARLFDLDRDAGDDVDRYPSYGPYWQTLDRPWTAKLRVMGVYELAARHAGCNAVSSRCRGLGAGGGVSVVRGSGCRSRGGCRGSRRGSVRR
jgi:hypothetical protein